MDLCRAQCQDVVKKELSQKGSLDTSSIDFSPCNSDWDTKSSKTTLTQLGSCSLCSICIHGVYVPNMGSVQAAEDIPQVQSVLLKEFVGWFDPERPFKPPKI